MPRKFFKRFLPEHRTVRDHRHLQVFGTLLHDPNLWHLNRRSIAGAFAVGLFMAWVPVPGQMAIAAALAILFRVNLPLSVALVWLTNPLTMPPMFYTAYKIGTQLLGTPGRDFNFELSFAWLGDELLAIWQPFLLGCVVAGALSALIGYVLVRLIWRWRVIRAYQQRPGAKRPGHAKQDRLETPR